MTFAYGLSKGSMLMYTRILSRDNPNLKVFAVSPGLIKTDMSSEYKGKKKPKDPF